MSSGNSGKKASSPSNRGRLAIITGRSNPTLAQSAAEVAGVGLSKCDVRRFSDGELSLIHISEPTRPY